MQQNKFFVDDYNSIAKFLHWVIAILIICNYIGGLTLDTTQFKFITLHKQFGMTILLLVGLRIIWRILSRYPKMISELSGFDRLVAKSGHYVLYLLMLAIPTLGVVLVQSKGYPLAYLGIIPIPQFIIPQPHAISHQIKEFHEYLAHLIIIFAVLHALFAIKHHFLNKDSVLLRMLPKHHKKQ